MEHIRPDGRINARAMCENHGRSFEDWLKEEHSGEVLTAYARSKGIPPDDLILEDEEGSWVPLSLALKIKSWLDPRFAAWVDGVLIEHAPWRQMLDNHS